MSKRSGHSIKKKPWRKQKVRKMQGLALEKCPQKKGVCMKTFTTTPRKPNSAVRKVAKIRLSNKRRIIAYLCGIGQRNLNEHGVVLIRKGGPRDTPNVHYHVMRGKYDFKNLENKKYGRSKYGTKKPDHEKQKHDVAIQAAHERRTSAHLFGAIN